MNSDVIKACWAYHPSPSLEKIKELGLWESAKEYILAEGQASLDRVYPKGNPPAIAYCHALEIAAETFLKKVHEKS